MRARLFLISLLLSSAACSSQADYAQQAGIENDPAVVASAPAIAPTAPAAAPASVTDNDKIDGGGREFSYSWPAAASAQPALAAKFQAESDRILANEKSEWADNLKDAPADCIPCRNREFSMKWDVVADTPAFLSLSGDFSTYTGGAHGMYGRDSLLWDKAAKTSLNGLEVFRSPQALATALGPKLCRALDAEREKRRGAPVPPPSRTNDDWSNNCPKIDEATVLVGSSTGKAFDRIGIWYGPYVAGPYAEGAYELNFPVDAAVLGAVKPEYARAFAAKR